MVPLRDAISRNSAFRPLVRDDRQPLGDRLPDAAGVIEVVMRYDQLGQRLAGHGRACAFDQRLGPRLARRRLEHRQVIGKLEEDRVRAAGAVQQPDALARRASPRRQALAALGAAADRTSAGAARSSIGSSTAVPVDVQLVLHDAAKVDDGVVAHRQHHALDRQIAGEAGAERHVAEVLVVRHPSDPGGQARSAVDGQRERFAGRHRDVRRAAACLRRARCSRALDGSSAARTSTTGLFSMSKRRARAACSPARTARPFGAML